MTTAARLCKTAGDVLELRVERIMNRECQARHSIGGTPYQVVRHVVQQGESIGTLAADHNTTPEQIRSDNRLHFPVGERAFVYPGQVLLLRANSTRRPKADEGLKSCEQNVRRRRSSGKLRRKSILYAVHEGDSLEGICLDLGVQEDEVRRCNRHIFPIGEPGRLAPGQILTIFGAQEVDLAETPDSHVSSENR